MQNAVPHMHMEYSGTCWLKTEFSLHVNAVHACKCTSRAVCHSPEILPQHEAWVRGKRGPWTGDISGNTTWKNTMRNNLSQVLQFVFIYFTTDKCSKECASGYSTVLSMSPWLHSHKQNTPYIPNHTVAHNNNPLNKTYTDSFTRYAVMEWISNTLFLSFTVPPVATSLCSFGEGQQIRWYRAFYFLRCCLATT